jgi:hypothetical protein
VSGLPSTIPPGSKLADVWLAIRDQGAQTVHEIEQRSGHRGHGVGLLIYVLMRMGAVVPVGHGLNRRYISARLQRWAA